MTGVIFVNNFDQADGLAITTANSANSGNAFGQVVSGATALTYSTEQKAKGTASMKVTPSGTAGSAFVVAKTPSNPKTYSFRFYIRLQSLPSVVMNVLFGYMPVAGGVSQTISLVNLASDGRFGVATGDASGGQHNVYIPTSAFTAALNHWYRLEGTVVMHPTAGSVLLKVFDGDATTPLATLNPTGIYTADASNPGLVQLQLGKGTTTPTISPFYIDALAVRDDATLPGPYVPPAASVTANAGLAGTALSLSATAVTYDQVVSSYAWTQTAGPSVITGTVTTATVSRTLTVAGTYTFHLDITDDLGRHAVDDVSVTYSGSTAAPVVSGTTNLNQWIELLTATPAASGAITWSTTDTGITLVPNANGTSCIAYGPSLTVAKSFTVHAVEAGNANTTDFRFTIAGGSSSSGGGVRILQATADQSAGGVFA